MSVAIGPCEADPLSSACWPVPNPEWLRHARDAGLQPAPPIPPPPQGVARGCWGDGMSPEGQLLSCQEFRELVLKHRRHRKPSGRNVWLHTPCQEGRRRLETQRRVGLLSGRLPSRPSVPCPQAGRVPAQLLPVPACDFGGQRGWGHLCRGRGSLRVRSFSPETSCPSWVPAADHAGGDRASSQSP